MEASKAAVLCCAVASYQATADLPAQAEIASTRHFDSIYGPVIPLRQAGVQNLLAPLPASLVATCGLLPAYQ